MSMNENSRQETKQEQNHETEVPEVPSIHVAKIAVCDSLSGLSQLEYHIGYDDKGNRNEGNIFFRIWKNSGGGKFNTDWVSLDDIQLCFSGIHPGNCFKASVFNSLLPGKSTNTPGFIAGVCLAEGLICRSEKESRQYELNDWTAWRKQVQTLIDAETNLTVAPVTPSGGHSSTNARQVKAGKKAKSVSGTTAGLALATPLP
jgi:hypothetical protein